jgi:hypothetical protein
MSHLLIADDCVVEHKSAQTAKKCECSMLNYEQLTSQAIIRCRFKPSPWL